MTQTFICFVRLWKSGFLGIETAPVLSCVTVVGFRWVNPKLAESWWRFFDHDASFGYVLCLCG